MNCPDCKRVMAKHIYKVKKADGRIVWTYYCDYCCKVRECECEYEPIASRD